MCLASVYAQDSTGKKLIFQKAARVTTGKDKVLFEDFLGRTLQFDGHLTSIDLENNVIICSAENSRENE